MKGKPIEPGCLAMIVGAVFHPRNNGKVVRVVRLMTEPAYTPPELRHLLHKHTSDNPTSGRVWVVETLDGSQSLRLDVSRRYSTGRTETLNFDVSSRAVAEIRLKRLDDGEDHKEREITLELKGIL